ncbi:hypothetical protein ACQ4WX_04945 [Streptomyces lasalocidi]
MDEFAFREGCTYGTELVGTEAGRGVDVLPDCASETFEAWMKARHGAEIIGHRGSAQKTCHQHRNCLRKRAEQEAEPAVPDIAGLGSNRSGSVGYRSRSGGILRAV